MKTERIRAALLAIALGGLTLACDSAKPTASAVPSPTAAMASAPGAGVTAEWAQEIFIDYAGSPSHAGPGPHPTTESGAFRLSQGGIRWPTGGNDVEYQIVGAEALSGGNAAVQAGLATWDGFILTRNFVRNEATTQTNPCIRLPSRIHWLGIDGPGGVLAIASVCRNVVTKEIVGFVVSLDVTDNWSTSEEVGVGKFDLENAASHEWGHVAGLGHVNAPKDGCLAMYTFAAPEETQKRTLGLGDKLGMQRLYASTNVTAGTCGA